MSSVSNSLNTNSLYLPNKVTAGKTVAQSKIEASSTPVISGESVVLSHISSPPEPLASLTSQTEQAKAKETPNQVSTSPTTLSMEDFAASPLVSESSGEGTSVPNNGNNPNGTLTILDDIQNLAWSISQNAITGKRESTADKGVPDFITAPIELPRLPYTTQMGARITSNC